LRLIARLDEARHGHVFAYFWCSQFINPKSIHLIVDTGCTTTTILSDDVTRLGINCNNLRQGQPTSTANGLVIPYVLPNVRFIFEIYHGWLNRRNDLTNVDFNEIHCNAPTHQTLMTRRRVIRAYSVLGMDFLGSFRKWKFTDDELYLDTV
jgi:hypothetical protein